MTFVRSLSKKEQSWDWSPLNTKTKVCPLGGWPKDQIRTAASSILVLWVRMESGGIGLLLGFSRCSHAIVRPVKTTKRVTTRRALYSLPSCY